MGDDFYAHAFWYVFLDMLGKELSNPSPVLIGYQTHGYLCVSGGGDDGLGSLACETSPDAVYVKAGTDTGALGSSVALLSVHIGNIEESLVLVQVERGEAEYFYENW